MDAEACVYNKLTYVFDMEKHIWKLIFNNEHDNESVIHVAEESMSEMQLYLYRGIVKSQIRAMGEEIPGEEKEKEREEIVSKLIMLANRVMGNALSDYPEDNPKSTPKSILKQHEKQGNRLRDIAGEIIRVVTRIRKM